jgi:hypothetical protein
MTLSTTPTKQCLAISRAAIDNHPAKTIKHGDLLRSPAKKKKVRKRTDEAAQLTDRRLPILLGHRF